MSAPYQMTPAERALLQAGGVAQELPNAGGIQLSLLGQANPQAPAEGTSDKPPEEGALNTELRAFATAADTCFRNQDFSSAEDNYSKILRAAPQDVSTLCNISVVQLRQNKLPDAERNLLKALAYRFDNDFAHYLLGVVHLRQGKLAEARESIEQGLKIKPDNAEGHLSLGFICLKQSRYSAAEKEFKQAVELDSSCADAHFNLAVLYATTDDGRKLDLAKTHYRQAVAHGAPRDPRMDRLFRE
jgi:tetratricopeptide (TPR) repeat protein